MTYGTPIPIPSIVLLTCSRSHGAIACKSSGVKDAHLLRPEPLRSSRSSPDSETTFEPVGMRRATILERDKNKDG